MIMIYAYFIYILYYPFSSFWIFYSFIFLGNNIINHRVFNAKWIISKIPLFLKWSSYFSLPLSLSFLTNPKQSSFNLAHKQNIDDEDEDYLMLFYRHYIFSIYLDSLQRSWSIRRSRTWTSFKQLFSTIWY